MTSVGETLRRERLKRNLDLDYISRELKISPRLLDAIESDQYHRLPGGVFAKAFVRQYAQLVGLDGEDLASQVQRAIEPPSMLSAERTGPAVTSMPIAVPKVEEWRAVGDGRSRFSSSLPAAALVVVVMLICSGVYAWIQRPRTTTAQATPPAPARVETMPAAVTTPPPQASETVQPVAPPKPVDVKPAVVKPPQPAGPAGPVHVEILAEEVVWVLARVDGKFAFTETMEPNARRVLDGEKDVTLRLGNAGGVTISLNGKDIGAPGPKGQARTLQFTSGGFQIVSAKPPAAAPFDPIDRL